MFYSRLLFVLSILWLWPRLSSSPCSPVCCSKHSKNDRKEHLTRIGTTDKMRSGQMFRMICIIFSDPKSTS